MQSKYAINYQKHNGYIDFNNCEKITGIFEYGADEFPTYNLKSFTQSGKLIKRYKSNSIKEVVLARGDNSLSGKDSTYFKVLDKSKRLYRQLTFDKGMQIYDELFNVNERAGLVSPTLLIRRNGHLIKFNSTKSFINWIKENASDKIKWHDGITVLQIIRQLNGIDKST